MKQHKTIALIAFALLVLLPLAALAKPGSGQRGHGPGRGMFPPPSYLDLTEEQIEASQAIRDSVRAEMGAVRDETRTLRDQLRATLDGDDPDAGTVGQLMIEIHGLRQQTRQTMEDAESQFTALLTSEQLEKWENFKELRQARRGRHHRGLFGAGSGAGPGGGFGPAEPIS